MRTASETAAAIGVDSSGEIGNMIPCLSQYTGGKDADIAVFAVEVKVAGTVFTKRIRIVLPGFKGEVDGGGQVFLVVIFRIAQVDEKTARVGREGVQVVDS